MWRILYTELDIIKVVLTRKSLWAGHVFRGEIMIWTYRSLFRIFNENILSENHYGCESVESILYGRSFFFNRSVTVFWDSVKRVLLSFSLAFFYMELMHKLSLKSISSVCFGHNIHLQIHKRMVYSAICLRSFNPHDGVRSRRPNGLFTYEWKTKLNCNWKYEG